MNESIDVLKHVLTGNFIYFGCESTYFRIMLAVTAYILFLSKYHL